MKKFFFAVLIAMICAPAMARLGETEQQLTNRYGAPILIETNSSFRTLTFYFGEYAVGCRLRDGRSVFEYAALRKKDAELSENDALSLACKIGGVTNLFLEDTAPWQKTYGAKNSALFVQINTEPGRPQSVMVTTTLELQRLQKSDPSKSVANGF